MKKFNLFILFLSLIPSLCFGGWYYSKVESGGGTTLSFVIAAHDDQASNNTLTVASGSLTGLQDDDIMIALILRHHSETTTSTPTGWTSVAVHTYSSSMRAELWYKVASSESGSYTWDYTNNQRSSLTIAVYRGGFDTADPVDAFSNTQYITDNTTVQAAGITISANDSPLLVIGGQYETSATTFTAPASPGTFAEDVDYSNITGDHHRFFYSQTANSGATGNMDVTASLSASVYKHAFALSLNPD